MTHCYMVEWCVTMAHSALSRGHMTGYMSIEIYLYDVIIGGNLNGLHRLA
jgi:hypothetical protein